MLNVLGDFNFMIGKIFNYVKEVINLSCEVVWLNVYYDNIWYKWVVSVFVFIYFGNEFFGVIGSDIVFEILFF